MRQHRKLNGWRLWTTVVLLSLFLFSAAFSLNKMFSFAGSRWDIISWPAIAWMAAGTTLVVSLWTLLSDRMKR